MKEHKALPPQFLKPAVSCRFFFGLLLLIWSSRKQDSPVEYDWMSGKRKYTFRSKDEYDEEFGILLELGIHGIEEYFYIKGYHLGQKAFQKLYPDNQ